MALAKFLNIFALAFAKEAANLISIGVIFCGELSPNRVVRKIQIFQFHKLQNSLNSSFLETGITIGTVCSKTPTPRELNKLSGANRKRICQTGEKTLKIVEIQLQQEQNTIEKYTN
jgi:hypothetical protein